MYEKAEQRAERLGLELAAVEAGRCHLFHDSSEKSAFEIETAASQAISLKRVGDALEMLALPPVMVDPVLDDMLSEMGRPGHIVPATPDPRIVRSGSAMQPPSDAVAVGALDPADVGGCGCIDERCG
jgi:hypothetical protein